MPVNAVVQWLRPRSDAPSPEEVAAKREELLKLVAQTVEERRDDIRSAYDREIARDRT